MLEHDVNITKFSLEDFVAKNFDKSDLEIHQNFKAYQKESFEKILANDAYGINENRELNLHLQTLGIWVPSGIYLDVRYRLDIGDI